MNTIHFYSIHVSDISFDNYELDLLQEVCGMTWSPNHSQLASGGNDNTVKIW